MENQKNLNDQFDPINRIIDGVEKGAQTIKKRARSLSKEAERAVETIQNFSNESQSLVSQFQNILLEEPIQLVPENTKQLKITYMKIFHSILSMLFGQKVGEYIIFKIFNQLIDTESSILLAFIIIPVVLTLKYFPSLNKDERKEKLSERFIYIYSIFIGMILGFVFMRIQTDSNISYGIINASILFLYFNTPEFVLSIDDKRKNQMIISVIGPLSMIFIGFIFRESFVISLLALLFYSCINFISFQVYTTYNINNIKETPTALIILNIISEIYIKTVLSLIN
ncbi:Hypothetical protein SRAE_0000040100 [Strongyloides ratti]|uniref:Uncharacterized protein n=1 Tax=Strongyloides ratti TaxID=34506 RepID=A0A090KUV2_STRRB|nr:Hypothetical protein SRAE_0000040100 [Strongyloides ratti]CEF61275.1 Hypothetical protein SRAE_0000040100 [Strongyloides ratti]